MSAEITVFIGCAQMLSSRILARSSIRAQVVHLFYKLFDFLFFP